MKTTTETTVTMIANTTINQSRILARFAWKHPYLPQDTKTAITNAVIALETVAALIEEMGQYE